MSTHRLFSWTLVASTFAAGAQVSLCESKALQTYAPAASLSTSPVRDAPAHRDCSPQGQSDVI